MGAGCKPPLTAAPVTGILSGNVQEHGRARHEVQEISSETETETETVTGEGMKNPVDRII
jgi:hypothetical protein